MLEATTYLVSISTLTVILVVIGMTVGGIVGIIHVCQAAYWMISYVFRPSVLLLFQPPPSYGDSVADWRIASGGYETAMPYVLAPVLWGLSIYVALAALAAWLRFRSASVQQGESGSAYRSNREFVVTCLVAYLTGWVARLAFLAFGGSAMETLTGLAVVGAAGLIVFSRGGSHWIRLALLGPLVGELLWSALSASKTPIIAAGLALAIRWAAVGWSATKVRWSIVVGAGIFIIFPFLQRLKTDDDVQQVLMTADANYPSYLHPLMSVLRRFDLFSAMTDATLLDGRQWMDGGEFLTRLFSSLIPQVLLGDEKVGVGTLWSMEVRAASLGRANSDVSLAEGFIAEGYALNGVVGVACGGAFMLGLSYFTDRAIRSHRVYTVALGLLLISYPVLFERGVLGSIETLGKSLQVAALFWLLCLIVRQCMAKRGSGSHVVPALN